MYTAFTTVIWGRVPMVARTSPAGPTAEPCDYTEHPHPACRSVERRDLLDAHPVGRAHRLSGLDFGLGVAAQDPEPHQGTLPYPTPRA